MSKKKETQVCIHMSEEFFVKCGRAILDTERESIVERLMYLLRTGRITRSTTNAEVLEMLKQE